MLTKKVTLLHTTCPDEVDVDTVRIRNFVLGTPFHHGFRSAREDIGVSISRSGPVMQLKIAHTKDVYPPFNPRPFCDKPNSPFSC